MTHPIIYIATLALQAVTVIIVMPVDAIRTGKVYNTLPHAHYPTLNECSCASQQHFCTGERHIRVFIFVLVINIRGKITKKIELSLERRL